MRRTVMSHAKRSHSKTVEPDATADSSKKLKAGESAAAAAGHHSEADEKIEWENEGKDAVRLKANTNQV